MKKRFWTRLVSAVLTMAMAFSILAVPASAASTGNSWAIGAKIDEDTDSYVWMTELLVRNIAEQSGVTVEFVKNTLMQQEEGMIEYGGTDIPEEAAMGMTIGADEKTLWFTLEEYEKFAKLNEEGVSVTSTDLAQGAVYYADGTVLYAIGYESTDKPVEPIIEYTTAIGVPSKEIEKELEMEIECGFVWFLSDEELTSEEIKESESAGYAVRTGLKISSATGIALGLTETADGDILWVTEQQGEWLDKETVNDTIVSIGLDADAQRIIVTMESGRKINFNPVYKTTYNGTTETVKPSDTSKPSTPSSGSSSGDNTVAIIAVVGAAVAAVTGVYFYTHPEKWQEIKDYFADLFANVQAKFQEFTDGVKGALGIPTEEEETAETAEAAENAAVPQDAAA